MVKIVRVFLERDSQLIILSKMFIQALQILNKNHTYKYTYLIIFLV